MRALLITGLVLGATAFGCSSADDDTSSSGSTTTVAPTTTTTISPAEMAERQVAADAALIKQKFEEINEAMRESGEAGVAAQNAASYGITVTRDVTEEQCLAFYRANPSTDIIEVHEDTVRPAPEWFHPPLTGPPEGRVYEFTIDDTFTDLTTGKVTTAEAVGGIHATVMPDGDVKLFINC